MNKIVKSILILGFCTSSLLASCSCDISSTQDDIEQSIEDYVSDNTDSLDKLKEQLENNLKELKNRTNNIEKEEYFTKLKNNIFKITGSTNLKKYRLLDYRNKLFLSSSGIVEKTSELRHLYSLVKSLEDVENSFIINREN